VRRPSFAFVPGSCCPEEDAVKERRQPSAGVPEEDSCAIGDHGDELLISTFVARGLLISCCVGEGLFSFNYFVTFNVDIDFSNYVCCF
jgi:hypothetical protein